MNQAVTSFLFINYGAGFGFLVGVGPAAGFGLEAFDFVVREGERALGLGGLQDVVGARRFEADDVLGIGGEVLTLIVDPGLEVGDGVIAWAVGGAFPELGAEIDV